MNPSSSLSAGVVGSYNPYNININIQKIENGFTLAWYSPADGNHQFYAADLATVDTKLAEIFGLGTS